MRAANARHSLFYLVDDMLLKKLLITALTGLACLMAGGAQAQGDYPNKPVKIIVPFPPGQATDHVAHL